MNKQNYSSSQTQNIPQPTSNSVFFNDQPRTTQDQSKNYPFSFQQNKNNTNKYYTRNQPPYYTAHYSPSEDEECHNKNHQRFRTNQQHNQWNTDQPDPVYQPDIFGAYTRNEQARQPRYHPTSYNNNFQP